MEEGIKCTREFASWCIAETLLIPLTRKHRRQGEGHKQREQRGDGNRHTKASEELTDDSAHKCDGYKDHHIDEGNRKCGKANLTTAF